MLERRDFLCCIVLLIVVMVEFPTNWQWWVALGERSFILKTFYYIFIDR